MYALHYLARVVSGDSLDDVNGGKPALPAILHFNVLYILCQCLYGLLAQQVATCSTLCLSVLDAEKIQNFVLLTLPHCKLLDVRDLSIDSLYAFVRQVSAKLKDLSGILRNPSIAAHVRLYKAIDGDLIGLEEQSNLYDSIKNQVYALSILQSKLYFISNSIPKSIDILSISTAQVLGIEHSISVPVTFLIEAGRFFDGVGAENKFNLVGGVLNYRHFILVAQLLSRVVSASDLTNEGSEGVFKIQRSLIVKVYQHLYQAAEWMIGQSLLVCTLCTDSAITNSEFSIEGGKVPCKHFI